jgi:alpha-ribazole phosphatase
VRHGETALNASRRFQGRSDEPLSERGRRQAEALADALRRVPFTNAYSSDLQRALETARTIAAPHGVTVVPDARLREFDFGLWEGLTWTEIVERFPELAERPPTQARSYAPPEGERFEDVEERVGDFLRDLQSLPRNACVLIVTHAGALHAAFTVLAPKGANPRVAFANASITRVVVDGKRSRVLNLSEVGHLKGIE